jgi:hypothetical protein
MPNSDNNMPEATSGEVIIRQHRRWTRWLESGLTVSDGNLILTNRRLLFLHRIGPSAEVSSSIKRLADAPMEVVLDHALTMHKNCLEIPLGSISRVGIGAFVRFPFPVFYLAVSYLKGKKGVSSLAAFQFRWPRMEIMLHPQLIADWGWVRAIRRAKQLASR